MIPKFRVYVPENNKMYYIDGEPGTSHHSLTFQDNRWSLNQVNEFIPYPAKYYLIADNTTGILMQGTGRKDINGVEIYAGDKARCKPDIEKYYKPSRHDYTIEWGDDHKGWLARPRSGYPYPLSHDAPLEVIGNIYEGADIGDN